MRASTRDCSTKLDGRLSDCSTKTLNFAIRITNGSRNASTSSGKKRPPTFHSATNGSAGVRVIAGEAKGRRLKGPAGPWTRPMADKIKEALFSVLGSLGVEPDTVLDLYAGTGSVGIEALSRGAISADFVDQNAASCAVIRDNLASTGYS